MKRTANLVAGIVALTGVSLATVSLNAHPGEIKAKKAVDTLVQQLQRRFHDRDNVVFGYGRIIRDGRAHFTTVLDIRKAREPQLRDDGQPLKYRQLNGGEFEIAPGQWIPYYQLKEKLHPENDSEKQVVETLRDSQVAIYTAGVFAKESGQPGLLKGPAYLRYVSSDAPAKESIANIAAEAWAGSSDEAHLRQNGWEYRVVKVRADDQTCINCHNGRDAGGKSPIKPLAMNDPVGVFIIGIKSAK